MHGKVLAVAKFVEGGLPLRRNCSSTAVHVNGGLVLRMQCSEMR